jgi:eukaryotic-like serine/threonine-protein kinase
MIAAPVPHNEHERLAALDQCRVVDSEPEPSFDDIAQLASQLCGTPIALVSLVDARRQWFKARVGLALPETSRDVSFCAHAVGGGQPLIVPDALDDPRFRDNPMVTADPNIRFYAGVPLVLTDGLAVGTLCVIDRVPRELSAGQRAALDMLARQVTTELELRRRLAASAAPSPAGPGSPRVVEGDLVAGRYRVEQILGVGGMGIVVAASDLTAGRRVAIKFMLPEVAARPEALERFVREARALMKIDSAHVARIFDAGNLASGAPYIVMEHLEGRDLRSRLAAEGPLPPEEAAEIVRQACVALDAAHARGVLHRDLKPANLFLAADQGGGTLLKVLDFGIAKFLSPDPSIEDTALTQSAVVVGSPRYMSPEQIGGERDLDERTDVWSLGVVLYELLSGALPFEGRSAAEICLQVVTAAPPPLETRRPGLPAGLCAVVTRCLARERDDRFPGADALARALAPLAGAPAN